MYRSSHLEVFLQKSVLKICSKFTGEHPCRSVISIKLQSNIIEITLWNGCSHVTLQHIFRTPFLKNASGGLLFNVFLITFSFFFYFSKHFIKIPLKKKNQPERVIYISSKLHLFTILISTCY